MNVRVLFFAQLKDFFGGSERIIEIQEGTTVDELLETLLSKFKGNGLRTLPLRYAVNERFEAGDTQLRAGDVLALIPPVSGG